MAVTRLTPAGDNSNTLCDLCGSESPGQKCTDADPYAGMEGAFRCLVERGDIAFVKHTTAQEMMSAGLRKGTGVREVGDAAITSTAIPRKWGECAGPQPVVSVCEELPGAVLEHSLRTNWMGCLSWGIRATLYPRWPTRY